MIEINKIAKVFSLLGLWLLLALAVSPVSMEVKWGVYAIVVGIVLTIIIIKMN